MFVVGRQIPMMNIDQRIQWQSGIVVWLRSRGVVQSNPVLLIVIDQPRHTNLVKELLVPTEV